MDKLKKEIANGKFSNIYLFYGNEDYLKKKFRKNLEEAVLEAGTDMMNYNYFEGKKVEANKIIESCETIPFMAKYRIIVVENSGLFTTGRKDETQIMSDYIAKIPKSTIILFVEEKTDKNKNLLYKTVYKNSEICRLVEMNTPETYDLVKWVTNEAEKENIKIERRIAEYIFEITNADMHYISKELEKLMSYCMDTKVITKEVVDKLINKSLDYKVYEMTDFIGKKQKNQAFEIFRELVKSGSPLGLLTLIENKLKFILQCKVFAEERYSVKDISAKIGERREFLITMAIAQGRNFKKEDLVKGIENCLETDIAIKTGKLNDVYALELLIASL